MLSIQTVLSPLFLPLYAIEEKVIVVIDILRATSSMCVAFAHGATRIIPVATPEESISFSELGFICAAERDGKPVKGFDVGNSPFSFMGEKIKGSSIAITTTNGTHAIEQSKPAAKVVIGSFLNKKALCEYLMLENKNVILLCSGWKNNFNLEDTLFAGAVCDALKEEFRLADDSSIAANDIYSAALPDLYKYVQKSSHAHRFHGLGIVKDIEYCMQENIIDIVPELQGEFLVVKKKQVFES